MNLNGITEEVRIVVNKSRGNNEFELEGAGEVVMRLDFFLSNSTKVASFLDDLNGRIKSLESRIESRFKDITKQIKSLNHKNLSLFKLKYIFITVFNRKFF